MSVTDPGTARRRLAELRRRLEHMREGLKHRGYLAGERGSVEELSLYDNHPADIGAETFEREKDLGLQNSLDGQIRRLERAEKKLAEGTYGLCDRCGRPIGEARLAAAPDAVFCIECQKSLEGEEEPNPFVRPVEEKVLNPPFGRSFTDDTDQVGYDGEDAWQEVALYGSSDTPSDMPEAKGYPDIMSDADELRGAVEPVEHLTEEGDGLDEDDRTE